MGTTGFTPCASYWEASLELRGKDFRPFRRWLPDAVQSILCPLARGLREGG